MRRKNILVSAYALSPYQGSECAVGWNIVTRLATVHDVTVLCGDLASSQKMKKDLDRYFLANPPIPGLAICYVAPGFLTQLFEKIHNIPGLWMVYYWAYNLWQRKAYRIAKALHAKTPFDLVHQLNMIGYREPGYLWKLPVPFVWGPIGGSPNEPMAYSSLFSWSGYVRALFRNLFNEIQKRTSWRAKCAARKAVKLWAVTSADMKTIRNIWGVDVQQMLETGTIVREGATIRSWNGNECLRIVWSGIHLPRKALPILFHAIADDKLKGRVKIDVLGGGSETGHWKSLAKKLGIEDSVKWHGMLTHQEALNVMANAHVLVFTSIKEGTPHVVLEALSLGLPAICHDACGMGVAIDDRCGIKVPLYTLPQSKNGFTDAILKMLENPLLVRQLSDGALKRAQELSWDNIVDNMVRAYEKVIQSRDPKCQAS
jgi:glycosyltransferase involved in cell wall biosynthesis